MSLNTGEGTNVAVGVDDRVGVGVLVGVRSDVDFGVSMKVGGGLCVSIDEGVDVETGVVVGVGEEVLAGVGVASPAQATRMRAAASNVAMKKVVFIESLRTL